MIARSLVELVFQRAVHACDPGKRVGEVLGRLPPIARERRIGIAVGKSALAMARGIGPVARGQIVTVAEDGGELPAGWRLMLASHPIPDERSLVAGRAVFELVRSATEDDHVIAAISGGASSLIEQPRIPLAEFITVTSAVMKAGAPIDVLNFIRTTLSAIKGGQLALACRAPITTLAASDVIGDRIEIIGSGPTVGPWLEGTGRVADAGAIAEDRRLRAIQLLERMKIAVPKILREPIPSRTVTRSDRALIVSPLGDFAKHVRNELSTWGVAARGLSEVLEGDIAELAVRLARRAAKGPFVGYGEPTIQVPIGTAANQNQSRAEMPIVGEGGRAQQLALELARHLRGTSYAAFVVGTDGKDGPAPRTRPSPAGAYVDGSTWDRILATGIDPELALVRRDAGTALYAVDALFVSGPTGINHADVVIVG